MRVRLRLEPCVYVCNGRDGRPLNDECMRWWLDNVLDA